MQTKNLIQSSARIVRITDLHVGNIVKMVDESYSTLSLKYALVTDLLNSGDKTFVELMTYDASYSSVNIKKELFAGDKDISLFPTKLEDVKSYLHNAIDGLKDTIKDDKKKLQEKVEGLEKAEKLVSGELSKKLTEASFKELTTEEYAQIAESVEVAD